MALKHTQLATLADGVGVTKTITFDFTPLAGETLVLSVGAAATASTPVGWTKHAEYVDKYGSYLFSKVSDGTETSVSWTQNGDRAVAAIVVVLSNVASLFGAGATGTFLIVPVSDISTDAGTIASQTFGGTNPEGLFIRFNTVASINLVGSNLNLQPAVASELTLLTQGVQESVSSQEDAWISAFYNSYTNYSTVFGLDATNFTPTEYAAINIFAEFNDSTIPFGATIAEEIALPGDIEANWNIIGAGSTNALGFSRKMSANVGETVDFAIHSTECTTIDIYRIGGYDTGWRKIDTIVNTPVSQPDPVAIANSNGATEASAWTNTASWTIPSNAWSGLFVAVPRVTGNSSFIPFVVRQDARTADIVVKTSETTWALAYNSYGTPASPFTGKDIYGQGGTFDITNRSLAVSLDRPIITRNSRPQTYWMNSEMPLWRWLDKQGANWKLIASVDLDAGLTTVGSAKALVSSGHDEYWSQGMRDNAEAFRDAGGHLIFMSGNEVFWRVRFSPDRRTMWCYKDTMSGPDTHVAGTPLDPVSWTGTWKDTRWVSRNPENTTTGTDFRMNGINDLTATIVAADVGALPMWRGTTVATGTNLVLPRVVGFEADSMLPTQTFAVAAAATSLNIDGYYADNNGENYTGLGTLNWGIQLQRYPSGAVVAGFGTCQWQWALDGVHDRTNTTPSIAAQQATINLLTDMGAVIATPTAGLTVPTAVSWADYGLGATYQNATGFYVSDGTEWWNVQGGDAAVAAHEAAADPHTEYLKPAEILAGTNVTIDTTTTPGSVIVNATGSGGTTDHGALTGLADDDHTQYFNQTRGDARYSLGTHDHDTDYEALGAVSTAITNHELAVNPHPDYLKEAEADLLYSDITHNHSGVYDPSGTAASAVSTHAGEADPHTGYQKESEKNAANGYAGLDAGTKIAIGQLPTGTTGTTVSLGDHTHTQAQSHGTSDTDSSTTALHHTLGTGANQAAAGNHTHTITKTFAIPFSMSGTLSTFIGSHRFYFDNAATITGVRISVGTAPTGASLIVDVNKNGTTIFGTQANRPTIAVSEFTAVTTGMSVTSLNVGDYLTVDLDQVGSTVAGSNLTVSILVSY